jgi:hypothetical protein
MAASLIYFGPYLKPPVGLLPFTQFNNGFPPTVQAVIKKHPGFASLFVEPAKLQETVRLLKNPGSPQAQVYNHFRNLLVKVKKK